jgi:hypothetical protein
MQHVTCFTHASGARTCFRHVTGVSYETALSKDKEELPAEFSTGVFCDKFEYRCDAAARTWQRNHAQDNLMYARQPQNSLLVQCRAQPWLPICCAHKMPTNLDSCIILWRAACEGLHTNLDSCIIMWRAARGGLHTCSTPLGMDIDCLHRPDGGGDGCRDLVPLGAVRSNFNFDLTDKRVLNVENVVTDDDNIKQDISIDVYGRKTEEDAAAAPAAAAVETVQQEEEEKEDDLDSLLMA